MTITRWLEPATGIRSSNWVAVGGPLAPRSTTTSGVLPRASHDAGTSSAVENGRLSFAFVVRLGDLLPELHVGPTTRGDRRIEAEHHGVSVDGDAIGCDSPWERGRCRYVKWAVRLDGQADKAISDLIEHGTPEIASVMLREPSPEAIQTAQRRDHLKRWGGICHMPTNGFACSPTAGPGS